MNEKMSILDIINILALLGVPPLIIMIFKYIDRSKLREFRELWTRDIKENFDIIAKATDLIESRVTGVEERCRERVERNYKETMDIVQTLKEDTVLEVKMLSRFREEDKKDFEKLEMKFDQLREEIRIMTKEITDMINTIKIEKISGIKVFKGEKENN